MYVGTHVYLPTYLSQGEDEGALESIGLGEEDTATAAQGDHDVDYLHVCM